MKRQRVLVAMSGGVDSSVAALLMQRQGYEVIGMTAELFGDASVAGPCCGKAGICQAAAVCETLGIEHHQFNMTELFEAQVIDRFLDGYEAGRTPNPCSDCNRFIKFDAFFEHADSLGCELLATGHYARILPVAQAAVPAKASVAAASLQPSAVSTAQMPPLQDQIDVPRVSTHGKDDRRSRLSPPVVMAAGIDPNKDQSYFLACITPERLRRVRFPIGELSKPQVRELAAEANLPTATRKESQDICFMGNGVGIRELLNWHRGREPQPGPLVDDSGRVVGTHAGVENYTVGQRRGLKLGGGTEGLAVHQLDAASNTVVLAKRGSHPVRRLVLSDFTDLAPGRWSEGEAVMARGRYRQPLWPAEVRREDGAVAIYPQSEVFQMAPGQWCVGYDGDVVLWGGIIREVEHG